MQLKIIVLFILTMSLNLFAQTTGSPTRPASQVDNSQASDAKDEQLSYSKTDVPTGKYITGGVLGSVIGFGLGHGIQGRYSQMGWLFTATEAAGLAMFTAGCSSYRDRDLDGDKECKDSGLAAAGLVVMIGFHVWEAVDLWVRARPVDTSEPVAFLLPNPKSPGIGLAWRF